ncbi:hypothetical protein BX281_0121 [Streptomyces sp. Ag82_O1-15]|uniref:alpha/beta hydrolase n=1 Tax=Streptomyces sp. Ag82_O1-15 TaxID=1938855 RepID=UPI000BB0DB48|nr:alpha/beta fold hydrolase [Streptomyces sp. Ag82_O1-15]PBC92466.1 hypothetical protein BX281_0121 [Streptomyces sp. Ag82_O1-15]
MIDGIRRTVRSVLYPGADIELTPDQVEASLTDGEQLAYTTTTRGERIAVILRPARHSRAWALFLGGNGMTAAHASDVREALDAEGISVACADYVGFGLSAGTPSESGCYRTADAVLAHLAQYCDTPAEQVVVVGWSLGSAVAVELASRRRVLGIVLLSPMTSVFGTALDLVRVGASPLDGIGPFAAAQKARGVRCPALVISGSRDPLTRPWMARKITSRLGGDVVDIELPGRTHVDLLDAGTALWRPVAQFIGSLAGR